MTLPTIHLNGTSAQSLLDQQTDAGHAVYKAMEALGNAAPNARDYYVQGDGAFQRAAAEHTARMEKLRSVYDDLQKLAEHIADHL